jgi:predicted nucleic acid-binding protein
MKLEDNELVFFSDDSAARMASEALGITSIGTIGIIIKSASIGKISKGKAIEIIESINSGSTLYVKSSLVQTIVERLRNEWGIPE